jgi:DNA-binding beta-propeller fold protein YncE
MRLGKYQARIYASRRAEISAAPILGEMSVMKFRTIQYFALGLLCSAILVLNGCSSSGANVITVTVSPSSETVIAGQVATFTATVGGSTTTTVSTWTCGFTYTPLPTATTPNPTVSASVPCTSGTTYSQLGGGSIGTWVTSTTNGSNVLTYTAPALAKFPNPAPTITFTAEADANKSKTGTTVVSLDSGIRISLTPGTATVPVGLTPAQTVAFSPACLNSNCTTVQWHLVQPNSGNTTTVVDQTANPLAATCNPTCGSIDVNGVYTAPATLPTDTTPSGSVSTAPTTVYVVANSSADTVHYATSTITLVNATTHPLSFDSISPSTIPVGGTLQDIYLSAKNLLNTTNIFFTPPGSTQQNLIPSTNVFTIPISLQYCTASASGVTPVVTCDASLMTRVRLPSSLLGLPGVGQITVAGIPCNNSNGGPCNLTASNGCTLSVDSGGTTASISCPLTLAYTSPTLVASVPYSFPQGMNTTLVVDGGYFGPNGIPIVQLLLDSVTLTQNGIGSNSPTQLVGSPEGSQISTPGLFEVSVKSDSPLGSTPLFPIKTTNIAVQPTFAGLTPNPSGVPCPTILPPLVAKNYPPCVVLPGGGNPVPSGIALDSAKQFAVLTDEGTNMLQIVDLSGPTPSVGSPVAAGAAPTGIAIDNGINIPGHAGADLGIVVSSGDSKLYLYAITRSLATSLNIAIPVDLATLLDQHGATGLATPYAFGVDPVTHLGVVVYQNTNIAFIVDVNPNLDGSDTTHTCFLSTSANPVKPPCVIAPVSLTTGADPHVIMQPGVPLAYVTPGSVGSTSVVNLLQQGTSAFIAPAITNGVSGAVRTSGITAIITNTPTGINPALGGTVIISGLLPADLNGTFQIIPGSVTSAYSFSYAQPGLADETETNTTTLGEVQYGTPYYSFNTSAFASGGAINPQTRTFAYADYNATIQQIGFITTLDQLLTTLSLSAGSYNGYVPPVGAPPEGPEIGFRWLSFDPYTNVLIAYDPSTNPIGPSYFDNAISLINPGGPGSSASSTPYRIVASIPTGQQGTGSFTPAGASAPVTVNGPMIYDPKTRYVLVANAGSNTLSYLQLDPTGQFKKVAVSGIQVTSAGVASAQPPLSSDGLYHPSVCQPSNAALTCMPQAVPLNQPASIRIFGQGFSTGAAVARLDTSINVPTTVVNDGEVDITIPASQLTAPHDYSLDVSVGGVNSNAVDLYAVGVLDLTPTCLPTTTNPQGPEAAAIDPVRLVAFVTNYSCNSVTAIAVNQKGYTKADGTVVPYGTVLSTVTVGPNPIGIGVSSRLGYAVVANYGDTPTGSASIINISNPESMYVLTFTTTSGSTTTTSATVPVGLAPLGVTIDDDHSLALIANNGSNTISSIDLTVLLPGAVTDTTPTATTVAVSGAPTAIAVDPNRAVAVVTLLQNSGTTSAVAGLDVVSLSSQPPAKSTSASVSSLTASLTGIVYDPAVNPALFYAASTQQNAVYSFDPDSGNTQLIRVGINPFGLAYNYNTGTIVTVNSTSNTMSVIDSQNFKTRDTIGIGSLSQFPVTMDIVTNTAIIVDQNNNRVLFMPVPK